MERIIILADKTIVIKLGDIGIYDLGIDSSTGKSFIAKLLKAEETVKVLEFSNEDNIINELEEFEKSNKSILFFDRFDLTKTNKIINKIKSINNKYIILDFKDCLVSNDLITKHATLIKTKEGFILNG